MPLGYRFIRCSHFLNDQNSEGEPAIQIIKGLGPWDIRDFDVSRLVATVLILDDWQTASWYSDT